MSDAVFFLRKYQSWQWLSQVIIYFYKKQEINIVLQKGGCVCSTLLYIKV